MNKLILLILFTLMLPIIHANTLVPVEIDVSVDFEGNRDLRLIFPSGYEKHYFWDENETHSDESFSITIYKEFDEEEFCENETQYYNYKNLSQEFNSMLDVCGSIIGEYNKTTNCSAISAKYDVLLDEKNLCEDRRGEAKNDSNYFRDNYVECNDELLSTKDIVSRLQGNENRYSSCESDLETTKKSKGTWFIGGLIAGIFGHIMLTKKKNVGPEEQQGNEGSDYIQNPEQRLEQLKRQSGFKTPRE